MSKKEGGPEKKIKKAKPASKKQADESSVPHSFPIVGMGGSAGVFEALKKFFTHMPPDKGIAFVVVLHLDPNHKGMITEIIQKYSPMKVYEAADGMKVEPNRIYVIPPNKDMGIHNNKLLLLSPSRARGYRMPIDYFFQSLAEDQWNKAVGIIFSGMGSDGELGVKLIKEKLGMVMVQDPETAEYSSMPQSSISTNYADYVLPPDEMPFKLVQYLNHPAISQGLGDDTGDANSTATQKILMLLRSHTGHDFSLYKKNTISRRIDRRIAFHQLQDYNQYVNYLRENPQEITDLFNELLIGVTRFFRDQAAFNSLAEKLTTLLKTKAMGETIRIWVAACSTGEEAYSIAILLIECLDKLKSKNQLKVQIFATDIDPAAIEHARLATYKENIVVDVSPASLERFFVKKNDHYAVKKELREMIVFAQHNIIKDAPFTKLDLLCCRNLMIYLSSELQKKLIPIFHYSLNYKGILFLGPAETIGLHTEMFSVFDSKWKLFERREGASSTGKVLDFPFSISQQTYSIQKTESLRKSSKEGLLSDTFNKILLETYTPPSVIINEKGDILYINGKTGKYLELSSGEAVMNIHKMAREELKYALSNAIHQVRRQKNNFTVADVRLKEKDNITLVDLKVSYIDHPQLQGLVIVTFEDKGILKKADVKQKTRKTRNPAIEELEKELLYTKQQLHTTIEQMETSLEELKSTNEELQSTNEELQSTNEESLTTKEEMQSLNEELMTINSQFQAKTEELTQLNNDMKNLLDSTEIGTLFLDNHLMILRFTPKVTKIFRIIPSDVGRSMNDISPNFNYPGLADLIRQVIEKLHTKEIQMKLFDNSWYSIRIMPYRTLDNFINGAVLTFTNITSIKKLETQLTLAYRYTEKIIDSLEERVVVLDSSLKVLSASHSFLEKFNISDKEINGIFFYDIGTGQWNTPELKEMLEKVISGNKDFHHYSMKYHDKVIGKTNLHLAAKKITDDENTIKMILLIIRENKKGE